jgi:hypothetical protein
MKTLTGLLLGAALLAGCSETKKASPTATPPGTVEGTNAFGDATTDRVAREIEGSRIWWVWGTEECYLSVHPPVFEGASAFVTVPDDWCRGMR